MLHPFVNAAASGRIHPSIAAASTALHAAILFLVVAPTQPVRYTERPKAALERLQLTTLAFGNAAPPASRTLVATQVGAVELPRVHTRAIVADFHHDIPLVTTPAVGEGKQSETRDLSAIVLHTVPKPANDLISPNFTYEMPDVEVQAVPAPTNPKPVYPPAMQRRHLEARFAVYFVVDTSGHIDRSSIELPLVTHEEFANAVLDALQKWTFEPAEVGGRRVRERVQQPFRFLLK